jgi:CBS domain-containing protein
MNVSEVMTQEVYIASPDETVQSAAQTMVDLDTGVLPVGDEDRLVGVLTDRDITTRLVAEGLDATTTAVSAIMSPQVSYCFEDDDVEDAASKMSEWQLHRLPVLNRDKRLVGILSVGDLARETTPEISGGALSGIADNGTPATRAAPR